MGKIALLAIGLIVLILGASLLGMGSERQKRNGGRLTEAERKGAIFEIFLCAIGLIATIVGAYQ